MESVNLEFDLYGSKNGCTRTDTVSSPLSEISEVEVFLYIPLIMAEVGKWYFKRRANKWPNTKVRHGIGLKLYSIKKC